MSVGSREQCRFDGMYFIMVDNGTQGIVHFERIFLCVSAKMGKCGELRGVQRYKFVYIIPAIG